MNIDEYLTKTKLQLGLKGTWEGLSSLYSKFLDPKWKSAVACRRFTPFHTTPPRAVRSGHSAASITFFVFSWSLEPVHAQPRHHVFLLGEHVTGFFWLIFSSQITALYQQMELILGPSSHLL